MGKYSVSLKKVVEDNSLGILYAPKPPIFSISLAKVM